MSNRAQYGARTMHADANMREPGVGPTGARVTEQELQDAREIARYFRQRAETVRLVAPTDEVAARWLRTAELLERAY